MERKIKQYELYYRKSIGEQWKYQDVYNKTEALGTAGLWIKQGYSVMIIPRGDEQR